MGDQYTDVSRQSIFTRGKNAIAGLLVGFVILILAFPVIWWNEGRSVERIKALDYATKNVVSISANSLNPNNDTKLVHVAGLATTQNSLHDPVFKIKQKAIKLFRKVQMFQWVENKSSTKSNHLGGSQTTRTRYTYKKEWASTLLNSSDYKYPDGHTNPNVMPYQSARFVASKVTLGVFTLSPVYVGKINKIKRVDLDDKMLLKVKSSKNLKFKIQDNYIMTGNADRPRIGDIKIHYEMVVPQEVSIMGAQMGPMISSFKGPHGDIALMSYGKSSSATMIVDARHQNSVTTWLIRGGGFLMMFFGLLMFLRPLSILSSVIPILGTFVSMGVAFISFLISISLSLLTIATAWIYYRPLFGAILLFLALIPLLFGVKLRKKNRPEKKPGPINTDENDVIQKL